MFEQTKRYTAIFSYICNSTLLFFYMGVNSIRADKFSYRPLVRMGLNKKEANISEQFYVSAATQLSIFNLWVSYDIRFSLRSFLLVKKNENCSNVL